MNRHKNWEYWNVSLWLFNEENYYYNMLSAIEGRPLNAAVELMLAELPEKTPDGAAFTFDNVKAAMAEIED
jgi:hypothetical protein